MAQYGLIGEQLGHSFSTFIHREFRKYEYDLMPIEPDKLDEFLKAKDFKGLNVTIPYKKTVMPYCDELSETAQQIGCVNTLVKREDGSLYGDNTDCAGFLYLAKKTGISFKDKKVLVLGSGATSLTVTAAAKMQGAKEVITVSRSGSVNYQNIYDHQDADILVNATPVGMYPNNGEKLVELARLKGLSGVLDVVYNPLQTALLQEAISLGLPCGCGISMLVAQAKCAAELFCGEEIEDFYIEEIEEKLRRSITNLVVIGMPGCGKSTLAHRVAERLGREAVDIDDEVIKTAKMTIPEIFEKHGEQYFRDLESAEIEKACKRTKMVIATGGGAVLREKNVKAMQQNAVIAWIQRPVEELPTEDRPLSKDTETLKKMLEERAPFYEKAADFAIENTDTVGASADKLAEGYNEAAGNKRP